jgi:hypothetical protein
MLFFVVRYISSGLAFNVYILFALLVLPIGYIGSLYLRYLLNRSVPLRISSEGIEENMFGFGFIPWEDIVGAYASEFRARGGIYRTLHLRVRDPDKYTDRVPFFVRPALPFRRDFLPLRFSDLDGTMEEALEWIKTFRPTIPIDRSSKRLKQWL